VELQIPIDTLLGEIARHLWPFVRIGAFAMVMPVIGGGCVPPQVRLLFALGLTVVIAPVLPAVAAPEVLSVAGFLLLARELLVGVAMGFVVQLLFDAVALGGQVIAMSMGLGFAVLVDRRNGINMPVLGQFFMLLAMLVFLAVDGHLALVRLLADSFTVLPLDAPGPAAAMLPRLLAWSGQLFTVAVLIALPAITALIVINLSFGVMSRAAPTLNLFAVGFPAAMLAGFVAVLLGMETLTANVLRGLDAALATVAGLLAP
jgi:flagellar biosynthetic protein FliR